ncbi:MAG: efflux RND transporter periplasmic adaptor subunit [Calditrichota bacterium]
MKFTAILFIVFFLLGCSRQSSSSTTSNPLHRDSARVEIRTFTSKMTGIGQILPEQSTQLTARFAGDFRLLYPGKTRYRQGDLIFQLSGPEVEYQRSVYLKDLESARADSEYYHQLRERQKQLYQKNFISPEQWQQLERSYRQAIATIHKADHSLKYFNAMTNFQAPFTGTLSDVRVPESGHLDAGTTIASFLNPDRIKLVMPWYDDTPLPSIGDTLSVLLEDSIRISSRITFTDVAAEPATGSREVWASLRQRPPEIPPETWVHYSLVLKTFQAPAVPATAIVRDKGKSWVLRAQHGRYQVQQVTTGNTIAGWIAIPQGIQPGETVLTNGAYEVYHQLSTLKFKVQD